MKQVKIFFIMVLCFGVLLAACSPTLEKVDVTEELNSNYQAFTPQSQTVIDKLAKGEVLELVVDGGATLDLIHKLHPESSGVDDDARVMPPSKPTTAATRPKLTLVMKEGGPPGEYYYLNKQQKVDSTWPRDPRWSFTYSNPDYITSCSISTWTNRNNNDSDDYFYITALIQSDTSVYYGGYHGTITPNEAMWELNTFMDYVYLFPTSLETFELDNSITADGRLNYSFFYGCALYNYLLDKGPANYYPYIDVPDAVFFNTSSGPIPETWFWNPPYHFLNINRRVDRNGAVYISSMTREGSEYQMLYNNWYYLDFVYAYKYNTNNLYSQGWRIRDIDIENGIATVLLKAGTYNEDSIFYVADSSINPFIEARWAQGYRGVCIDSSW